MQSIIILMVVTNVCLYFIRKLRLQLFFPEIPLSYLLHLTCSNHVTKTEGCIKNENLLGDAQYMLAGYTNACTGKILDDVSDALQRGRERRRREPQSRIFESIHGDVSGKNVETSISDDMEEMIKLTKKQELPFGNKNCKNSKRYLSASGTTKKCKD